MIKIDKTITHEGLELKILGVFEIAAPKIIKIEKRWKEDKVVPVITIEGIYENWKWAEWTIGFLFGLALMEYEVTGAQKFLTIGRDNIVSHMEVYTTHTGAHDHGFLNISSYGQMLRLIREKLVESSDWEQRYYEYALKVSGAVQASRWSELPGNLGYIYSYHGPHSLFVDEMRTLRSLSIAHLLGHVLIGEQDMRIDLLTRLLQHAETTSRYNIIVDKPLSIYDQVGKTAHETIFNINNGTFRCTTTQQGFSPFSTWTRGLAWAILGFAELLELIAFLPDKVFEGRKIGGMSGKKSLLIRFESVARAVADYYIRNTPSNGIPYWDTAAPNLEKINDYLSRDADPFNSYEPVDSPAAAIAAQGLMRLGQHLASRGIEPIDNSEYYKAGLKIADTLFSEPYLSTNPNHQGLLLHSIYNRPQGWGYNCGDDETSRGESSLWGDYHFLELAFYLYRIIMNKKYYTFFGGLK